MIPKVIHYCWFGGNPKSELIKRCIASWEKYCPDWEIKEWNETSFDISSFPYTKEAYEAKKWAFVSDFVRLYVVYEHGGVYMDTDVELLQSIEELNKYCAWYAFETNLYINTGMGFGATPKHISVKKMLEIYNERHFLKQGKPDLQPCPKGNTEGLQSSCSAFRRDGTSQNVGGVCVLSRGEYAKYAKHYGTATWGDGPVATKKYKDTKLKRFLTKPSRIDWIEKHLGKKAVDIYIFLSYDLLEMGPLFYINRQIAKFRRKK